VLRTLAPTLQTKRPRIFMRNELSGCTGADRERKRHSGIGRVQRIVVVPRIQWVAVG
jgi:hypothetical protein